MENTELVQGLYGSQFTHNKAVGYCQYHRAFLTVKTMKGHECLRKQCNALQKREEHDFWRQHNQKKEQKKANRALRSNYSESNRNSALQLA